MLYNILLNSVTNLNNFNISSTNLPLVSKSKSIYKLKTVRRQNLNKNSFRMAVVIDLSLLGIKREEIFNEDFMFSDKLTSTSIVESELQEIDDDEYRYSAWKNTQVGFSVGGSALGIWFAYKGLNKWELWMKEQEKKDIEEEIQMTGTYIDPGAGNIDVSIDPVTGKKIQIKPESE